MRLLDASHPPVSRPLAVLAGLLAAAAGLAAGELVAGLGQGLNSPVISIGNRVVVNVPQPVKEFAIDVFGTNDKLALITGTLIILAVLAALIGLLARRRPGSAAVATAALGGVGILAAALDANADLPYTLLPAIATTAVAVPALLWLVRPTSWAATAGSAAPPGADQPTRRGFLAAAGWTGGFAIVAATAGQWLGNRFDVAAERAKLALPRPTDAAPPVPPGAHPDVQGLVPFVTPNDDFYRIDTELVVPRLSAEGWTLRIHGMVDAERTWSYRELLSLPSLEVPITLCCVSNEVGGDLIGTARWQGVPLSYLFDQVGVSDRANQVVGRAYDGFTTGMPVRAAFDRNTLVAYAMNGEPLPPRHGFPIRLVTPGLYGYVSACKWMSEIELTTFDAFDQYWVRRGWVDHAPILTQSRIDTPGGFDRVPAGSTVPVAGVAWAPTRGITKVEVQVDDGQWNEADLADAYNEITWRQWVWRWDTANLSPGRHLLTVRATEGEDSSRYLPEGRLQKRQRTEPFPDGASGWHTIAVLVEPAA